MCTTKKTCERCGWDYEANKEKCPNCNAPTVTIEGVCVKDGMVNHINYHPVSNPVSAEGVTLICKNCGGQEFKNVTINVERGSHMKKIFKLIVLLMVGMTIISCNYPSTVSDMQDEEAAEQEQIESQRRAEEEKKSKEEEFVLKGWYYFRDNYLKAPSTASLNAYKITDDGDLVLEYDAQNGFGAMLRGRAFVNFENGEPVIAIEM